jgi:transposase
VLFLPKRLLPLIPAGLLVQQVLPSPNQLTILAVPRQSSAACPGCAIRSRRVHSRYDRTLGDLPWQGRPVSLRVRVRRFLCLNPVCSKRTFAERLRGVTAVASRRTERLSDVQRCLGLALGGEAGARLARRLAMPTSGDTLLRMACAASKSGEMPRPAPRVLGVDDWAWRRGHRYGTALVDLERNVVVDLLQDRQAETLATWLRQHPGVEVVARDRAGAYADGIRQGAPEARQVTDRWHLLRNLGDAVQALADRHGAAARRAARHVVFRQAEVAAAAPVPSPTPRPPSRAEQASQASLLRRQARYEEVARLHAEGMSLRRIAGLLGAERKTVCSWLRLGYAPLWRKPMRIGVLDPYKPFLERRWTEGCHNAAQLWREVAALGFSGRPTTVRAWATGHRQVTGSVCAGPARPMWQLPSRRGLARLLMVDTDALGETECAFVVQLLTDAPDLAEAIAAAKNLRCVLRRESDRGLEAALAAAERTSLASFAASLRRDADAVQAALELPWSTSPVEGQINRLKMIKRTMYGRAGFALLRARVLHAA